MRSGVLGSVLVAVVAIAACSGGAGRGKPLSAKQSSPTTMLAFVPAETPYVFAQLEPLPPGVRESTFEYTDRQLAKALEMAKQIPPDFDRSQLGGFERMSLAFLDELKGNDLSHWGRDLGLDPEGRFAIYGLSVWPVVRVGVSDAVKLRGVVGRVLAAANLGTLREETHDGRKYWTFTSKGITLIAAVLETEAVAAIVPTGAVGEVLPMVLGLRKPDQSLADTRRVADLLAAHHFTKVMFGYLDVRGAAAILTGHGGGALESLLHEATGPVSGACKADIERLVEIVPRLVVGYHALDSKSFHASLVAELPSPLIRALQSVHTEVPEVIDGPVGSPLFSVAAAIKLDALLPLATAAVQWAQARPFQCEWFQPLDNAFADLGHALGNPLPPAFQGLRGFSLVVDDLRMSPFDATGSLLVATDRAPDLIALFQHQVPGMSGITIAPDGQPVALPTAALGLDATTSLHASSRADRVGVAVGRTSAQRVHELVHKNVPRHSPLLTFAFDLPRMQKLGLVDKKEDPSGSDNMTNVVLQLDAKEDGLSLELFGTFAKKN